jgi:hypothetical protein
VRERGSVFRDEQLHADRRVLTDARQSIAAVVFGVRHEGREVATVWTLRGHERPGHLNLHLQSVREHLSELARHDVSASAQLGQGANGVN